MGQRARVSTFVFLRCPENYIGEYPRPIVQVMIRNVLKESDVLELQLQRPFAVSPYSPSSQVERIATEVDLADFQLKEQSG